MGSFDEHEVIEASIFSKDCSVAVGGCCEEEVFNQAAAYFSGYLVHKLNTVHKKKLHSGIVDYEVCSAILDIQDLNLHMFTSFKEYEQNVNSSWSLNYYSRSFIDTVKLLETIFINIFHKYSFITGFSILMKNTIKEHCHLPVFCCEDIKNYFINFFVNCRSHQVCKRVSQFVRDSNNKDKLKKIQHI